MIKNKYSLLAFCLLIILISFERLKLFIAGLYDLLFTSINLLTEELFWLIDYYFSLILFIVLFIAVFLNWRSKLMNIKLKLSNLFLLNILLIIVFYPLISGHYQPVDRNSVAIARIPPATSINYLVKKTVLANNIYELKNIHNQQTRIYFDSSNNKYGHNFFIKGEIIKINQYEIELSSGKPKIQNEFFIFGTEEYGRDLFVQIIFGIRKSIIIATLALIISSFIGLLLGYLSGMNENFFGQLINKFAEAIFSVPSILIFIVAVVFIGSSFIILSVIMGLLGWITIFKITRNEVILIKQKEFFITSQQFGLSNWQLILHEILIYISGQIILSMIFLFINFIFAEASLSFLGLSNDRIYTSLGTLIQRGNFYLSSSYWLVLFPSVALGFIVLILSYLKNIIRKKIDPRIL